MTSIRFVISDRFLRLWLDRAPQAPSAVRWSADTDGMNQIWERHRTQQRKKQLEKRTELAELILERPWFSGCLRLDVGQTDPRGAGAWGPRPQNLLQSGKSLK